MKKTIIAAVTGIIFGFIGCIAAIVKIFSKLCEAPAIRDEIVKSLKNLITVAIYGNNGSYRPYMSYYNYNRPWPDYCGTYQTYEAKYIDSVVESIGHIIFKSETDLDAACELLEAEIRDEGHISVADAFELLSAYADKDFGYRYLDTRYGWVDENAFRAYSRPGDLQLFPMKPVKLAITEETA